MSSHEPGPRTAPAPAVSDREPGPATPPGVAPPPRPLPVLPGRGIDRSRDRTVTVAGVACSAAFLLAAVGTTLVPEAAAGPWLPLHLALAGAAGVAIAALMPFFAATLVATAPAPGVPRAASIGLVTAGASLVAIGVRAGELRLGALGGVLYLVGMGLLLAITVRLLRSSLGARRRIFALIYGAALVSVLAGATLATLMLAGVPEVLGAWPTLRVAHAWLNVFGFVGLIVAATLIHLYPTVVGARIEQGRSIMAGIGALTAGPPLVAVGFIVGAWFLVASGAVLVTLGAVALVAYAADVLRRRARWSTDPDWHRFTTGSLTASVIWLAAAQVAAAAVAIGRGPGPAGWIGGAVIAPLVVGGIVGVIVGSWTHLLPVIGAGDPVRHAWQRRVLGRLSTARLVVFQLGVIVLVVAALGGVTGPVVSAGSVAVGGSLLVSLVLFVTALVGGRGMGRMDRTGRDLAT